MAARKRTKHYTKYGKCRRCDVGLTRAEYHADSYRVYCDSCRAAIYACPVAEADREAVRSGGLPASVIR